MDANLYPLDTDVDITEIEVKLGAYRSPSAQFIINPNHLFGVTDATDDGKVAISNDNGTVVEGGIFGVPAGHWAVNSPRTAATDNVDNHRTPNGMGTFTITYTATAGDTQTITVRIEAAAGTSTATAKVSEYTTDGGTTLLRTSGTATPPTIQQIIADLIPSMTPAYAQDHNNAGRSTV